MCHLPNCPYPEDGHPPNDFADLESELPMFNESTIISLPLTTLEDGVVRPDDQAIRHLMKLIELDRHW
jgi:hypothetical protein